MAASLVVSSRGWGRLQQILAAGQGASASCAVLWRRGYSSQQEQVSHKVDLPVQMENPYKDPPKRCVLCGINVDYKNVQLLSQFVSPYTGRIYGRHITGFMPVVYKDPTFLNDPKICDIRHPE
ncbi:28S ribosomal protein S18c, mitochondrial isoform X2 [Dermochelys coriacea]|uniref:28S ribosomal protein S18c, mitochondrial isoform X2 n=1 Tax=Dermochelys coriacea TaxID=27794 RepID=UPI001CA7CCCC|nr:28S ribosomal protein S18c, mitochondrial isoform X2 [Dermochelys coriacea]